MTDDVESYSVIKRRNAEYETEVHFQKCFGVLEEIFALYNSFSELLPSSFRFLDLGCAPGGFSAFLLADSRCSGGFGVTLTNRSGGFPMRLQSDVFFLQLADLFEVDVDDLVATRVHFLLCDAQYMRNNVAWDDKYTGVRLRTKQHGVWALLIKQLWLGLMRLNEGGVLVFRFGWKEVDDEPTVWYKKITLRLFNLMHNLFQGVHDVKSDYFNAKHSSFYVVCFGFKEQCYQNRDAATLFKNNFEELIYSRTDDYTEHEILCDVDRFRTPEVDTTICDMLDRVNKLRLVHVESCRWHERREVQENERKIVCIRPLPECMSQRQLEDICALYGRVITCEIEDLDGDRTGAIVFPNIEHAHAAVRTLQSKMTFGNNVEVWVKNDELDGWDAEWMLSVPAHTKLTAVQNSPKNDAKMEAVALQTSKSRDVYPSNDAGSATFEHTAISYDDSKFEPGAYYQTCDPKLESAASTTYSANVYDPKLGLYYEHTVYDSQSYHDQYSYADWHPYYWASDAAAASSHPDEVFSTPS